MPIDICAVDPVTREQLELAHDAGFGNGVLDGKRRNGSGNALASVAGSLPYTTGAMLSAAHEALRTGRFACAPVSGFHHAGYAHAGGLHAAISISTGATAVRTSSIISASTGSITAAVASMRPGRFGSQPSRRSTSLSSSESCANEFRPGPIDPVRVEALQRPGQSIELRCCIAGQRFELGKVVIRIA